MNKKHQEFFKDLELLLKYHEVYLEFNEYSVCFNFPEEDNNYYDIESEAGINSFSKYQVYEKPKEKVQYFQAMVSQYDCTPFPYPDTLFKDKDDYESNLGNSVFKLIQLVKFGDPT